MKSDAYCAGYNAYWGIIDDCPYDQGTAEWAEWWQGWEAAAEEDAALITEDEN